MIIELNGLPGCGKTTLKNAICSKHGSVRAVGVAEFRGEGKASYYKLPLKLGRFLVQFIPSNFGLYLDLRTMMRKAKQREGAQFSNSYENLITIMYVVYLYHTYRKNSVASLIVDEGIVQSLASCCAQMEIDQSWIQVVLRHFYSVSERLVIVNCECGVETSIRHIYARNRNDSAMDQLKDDKLQLFLERYQEQLALVRSCAEKECKQILSLNVEGGDSDPTEILEERIEKYL